MGAAPFLKWAGGKSKLLPRILPLLPSPMKTYYEPFIGGGAVFFALAREKRFRRAVVADTNPHLVEVYRCVRDDVEGLIEALRPLAEQRHDPEAFYRIRALDPASLSVVERAARFIYLNKTCFNGLYRVNRAGRFNVPFGRYKNPRVLDPEGLRAASRALEGTDVRRADFQDTLAEAGPGDGVYLDPPYVPLSLTSCFTSYTAVPFGAEEHLRLKDAYVACLHRRAVALLSNSDCPFTRKLYCDLETRVLPVTRPINRDAAGRGPVNEVLVCGWGRTERRPSAVRARRGAA
jgi:DNA adenine methylase